MKKIVVGSQNPVKLSAVEMVACQLFNEAEVIGMNVESGVSEQPMTADEGYIGAKNRAAKAMSSGAYDFGVGVESFVMRIENRMYVGGWIVVINKDSIIGSAQQSLYELPKWASEKILEGHSLGQVMGEYSSDAHIGQKGGTVELVSRGLVLRKDLMYQPLSYAFGRFLNLDFYNK